MTAPGAEHQGGASGPGARRIARTVVEPVAHLGPADRDAMFALLTRYYDRVERATFDADLAGKQRLIRMFDQDGRLAGFSTIQLIPGEEGRRRTLTVFSGDTVVDRDCWGQKALQRAFSRELVRLKLLHLRTRLYWFLISKGHKTYLLMRNNFTMYPTRDGPTPPGVQATLDRVARLKFSERYDAARGVIACPEGVAVKPEVADVPPLEAAAPDVRFFLERNPGWLRGDELCCLAEIRLRELLWAALRYTLAPLRRKPRPSAAPGEPERVTAIGDGGSAAGGP